MPWNILLLPLLGGFYYCTRCYQEQFRLRDVDGQRLLLSACLFGLLALIPAFLLAFLCSLLFPWLPTSWQSGWTAIDTAWHTAVAFPHSRKALLALFFAIGFTHWRNRSLDQDVEKLKVLQDEGDQLESLLHRAFGQSKPLLLTLTTRKVYIASLLRYSPSFGRRHVAVLPYRSGFRAAENLELTFVTDYVPEYQRLRDAKQTAKIDDFELVLKVEDIVSATVFDLAERAKPPAPSPESVAKKPKPGRKAVPEEARRETTPTTT